MRDPADSPSGSGDDPAGDVTDPTDVTTRQRIRDALEAGATTPTDLAARFDVTAAAAVDHVGHVARSVAGESGDRQVLAAPPECRDCGFDGFDDRLNRPSRCPECKSENVAEPRFVIE
ncbi:MAG: transcriptional regulator [Halobacteriaceae archaeon]